MAKMFPSKLPAEVLEDRKRSSEVRVYNALKEQLDDQYHVFYSSPWLGTQPDGSEVDGEADFLVAHPDKGMLSIEVKGGRVDIDGDSQWHSTDRYGIRRKIKNPVEQAKLSKHHLLQKLKESPYWSPRFICARHGVILTDNVRPARDFRPDMPLKLFAFDTDMDHLDGWVAARLGSPEEGDHRVKPLGHDGLAALDDMLARPVRLRVRLRTHVDEDLQEIQLKTDEQIYLLEEMEGNARMAIAGAAGTGKTILAIEKAAMLADKGKRVLLLCFNRPLGVHLARRLAEVPGVTATHFHRYCREVAVAAGQNPDDYSQTELASDLVDNFVTAGLESFDAVIVDEGQDFTDEWLEELECIVADGEEGVLYIFYDDNQRVMNTSASYIRSLLPAKHRLTRNFRNTRSIFREAEHYYDGSYVRPIGPLGAEPNLVTVSDENELKVRLAERVGSLIGNEGIRLGDITILVADQHALDKLRDDKGVRVGRHRATDAEHRDSERLCVDTVRRFKGLESPVILLVANADMASTAELLYVGITRAQVLLEIFGPPHVINRIKTAED
ncbi:NERD domain-containing protein [Pseudomonadota bacterium]